MSKHLRSSFLSLHCVCVFFSTELSAPFILFFLLRAAFALDAERKRDR